MNRKFNFNWYENTRYGSPMKRTNSITVKGTNDIGFDAKAATEVFCREFGNLKKNTIESIQEINMKGEPVGEPILPVNN